LLVADEVGQTAFRGPLWEVPVLGGSPRRLGEAAGQAAAWSPDGQRIVYADGHDLFLSKSDGSEAHKLVTARDQAYYPAWSPDGTVIRFNLGVVGAFARAELPRYHARSAEFIPFLSGISADSVSFSNDGQWVAYVTFPEGALWRSKSDGSQRLQLTYPPLTPVGPRWSPDGQKI